MAYAEAADLRLLEADRGAWLDRLEIEHDNLRAALAWALDGGDAEIGCRLAVALAEFWTARGYWNEGRRWLEAALAQSGNVASTIRAMVLLQAAGNTWQHEEGDWQQAWARVDEALALFQAAGDRAGIAAALTAIGTSTKILGDGVQAAQRFEAALTLYRELGDQHGIATTLHHLGDIVRDQGDIARGAALLEESLAIFRELGNIVEAGLVLNGLGDVACRQGDYSRALALYWESVVSIQPTGDRGSLLWALRNLGWMALIQGDDGRVRALLQEYVDWSRDRAALTGLAYLIHILGAVVNAQGDAAQATALLREGLMLPQRFGCEPDESLQAFAGVAVGQGQPIRAARMLGAIASVPRQSAAQAAYDHLVTLVRAQLDEATFAAAWGEGRALSLEQAIAEAQSLIRNPPRPSENPI